MRHSCGLRSLEFALLVTCVVVYNALPRRADGKPPSPYAKIPITSIDTPEHQQIAHQIVRESVVMLTNGKITGSGDAGRVLPIDLKSLKSLLVVGPTANDISVQAHTYHGTPSKWVINCCLESSQTLCLYS